mgnify:CR=1 FL=1
MLEYNEILPHRYIVMDGAPYEVLDAHIFRMQQRKPVNQTKLKNLISGKVTEATFHVQDKVKEAEIETKDVKYLYVNKGEYWFCEANDPSKRFKLDGSILGVGIQFIKANSIVQAIVFEDKIFGVKLPIKVELKVKEAPPAVKGDTSKGANKTITLETGATVSAPLFINEGEIVRINTETGQYVERV